MSRTVRDAAGLTGSTRGLARPARKVTAKAMSAVFAAVTTSAVQLAECQWSFVTLDQISTKADGAVVAAGCG